jgi:acetyl-CoA carboxylase/biotin carboxylase 1
MRDMFDQILKYGSYIVDSLRNYQQPVFIYIPPHGTLRGGAWVVVDSTINTRYMEMYADPTARGGVLETEGTVDVKFRKPDIIKAEHRLDETLISLDAELKALATPTAGQRSEEEIKADIKRREGLLHPLYHTVATALADLHDTPGRMKAKGMLD